MKSLWGGALVVETGGPSGPPLSRQLGGMDSPGPTHESYSSRNNYRNVIVLLYLSLLELLDNDLTVWRVQQLREHTLNFRGKL